MSTDLEIAFNLKHIQKQAQDIARILNQHNAFPGGFEEAEMEWLVKAISGYRPGYTKGQNFVWSGERNIMVWIKMGIEGVSTDGTLVSAYPVVVNIVVTHRGEKLANVDYDLIHGQINEALNLNA